MYHFSHHFLHKLCALFHLSARPTQLYNVTFLRWVREVDDDLKARREKKKNMFLYYKTQKCDIEKYAMHLKTFTSGNLSRISLTFSPFCPMMARWKRCSMIMSFVRSFSCWNHDILRDFQSRVARQLQQITQRTLYSEAVEPTDVIFH